MRLLLRTENIYCTLMGTPGTISVMGVSAPSDASRERLRGVLSFAGTKPGAEHSRTALVMDGIMADVAPGLRRRSRAKLKVQNINCPFVRKSGLRRSW